MLRIEKGKDETEELRFSSYLVQPAANHPQNLPESSSENQGGKHLQSSNKPMFK